MKNLEITLRRDVLNEAFTLGKLTCEDFSCFTVEDTVRELIDKNSDGDFDDAGEGKIKARTAIPYGRYKVIVTMSQRFKKEMPLLLDVPGFEGVRIHSGNNASHTEGCLILGKGRTAVGVSDSRNAVAEFTTLIAKYQTVYITIV